MTTHVIEMERTYYLKLDGYEAYVDVFIDGSTVRMDKLRLYDFDLVTDKDTIKKVRKKWTRKKIVEAIEDKYDFENGIHVGVWTDPVDGRLYDIHTIVELKDGFENYVLARDMETWSWVLLDVERVRNE